MTPSTPDFLHTFPRPRDEELNRAGRQGILEQKEDDAQSDDEWIAFQHRCWSEEFHDGLLTLDYLDFCLARGLHPATGARPRRLTQWPHVEDDIRKEQTTLRQHLDALFDDYGNYFGDQAAQQFRTFLTQPTPRIDFAVQRDLFADPAEPGTSSD